MGLNKSWRLFSVAGIEVRLGLTYIIFTLMIVAFYLARGMPWWAAPIAIAIAFVSILAHEFGHSTMARLVGGESEMIILTGCGGLSYCRCPPTWGRTFAVSGAGIAVNFTIAIICSYLVPSFWSVAWQGNLVMGVMGMLLAFTAAYNFTIAIFNLIPCFPLDGGRMLRAVLWPVVGIYRAMIITLYVAYVILALLLLLAIFSQDVFLALLVVMLGFSAVQEHRAVLNGVDMYAMATGSVMPEHWQRKASWWDRRSERREDQVRQAAQSKVQHENSELDRLLEKVSKTGLPSLTKKERAFLDEYAKRQRANEL